MTDQNADQIILIKYLVEAQEALANAKKVQEQITSGNEKIKSSNASASKSFQEVANSITNQGKAAGWSAQQVSDAIRLEIQRLQELGTVVTGIPQKFGGVGAAAKNAAGGFNVLGQAIGTALGFSAVQIIGKVKQALQGLIQYLVEATQAGYEFAKGMYQLQIGVNALRRAGTDITFGEVLAQLQKLKTEFGVFATKDLVVGASAFLNLNRDMGFTKEQLFSLQEAIATLAVVNGRSMDEVQKTVALALSSGYTEGLQRLGVSINRVTIAEEAARLGWDKGYTALTEQQRALATYNLVLEKTAVYAADLLLYQETLPGSIDVLTAKIIDVNAKTGESLLILEKRIKTYKLMWAEFLQWMAENSIILNTMKKEDERKTYLGTEDMKSSFSWILEPFTQIGKLADDGTIKVKNFIDAIVEANRRAAVMNQLEKVVVRPIDKGERDFVDIGKKEPSALTDDQIAAVESAGEKILDLQTQYDNDRRDLAIDLQRDLAEIEQDGADKIAEIMADHAQKMLDIANKASDQIRDAQLRYDLDVQQAWDEYYGNLASAAESHGNKLLKIEEDYQEKLKRLKEGFLLDLEDALHERDARQVLRLIRQYNLDRTQATRERDQNLRDEARAYEEQLHELDRQRRERLKKLKQELDLRLQMIATQRDRELALEVEKFNHEMAQQREENKKKREERLLKNQQDLDDLKLHLEDRLKLIAKDLADLGITTAAGMQAVTDIMNTYVGPGGVSDGIMNYFMAQIRAVIATMSGLSALSAAIPSETRFTNPNQPGFASGGMAYASKPTTAVFGEAGPELALFLPLRGGMGSISTSTKAPVPEMKQGDKGRLQVEVLLGAGLEGRIVDKTLNNVANVVLRSIRQ